jgi:hypothetical protein
MPHCPYCASSEATRRGSKRRKDRFQCKQCSRYYIDRSRSPNNVLSIDIETLPIKAYVWGTWKQNIYRPQIIEDWCLLSYSAKWIGNDNIISNVLTPQEAVKRDDKRITKEIWRLLDTANVAITHNGKRFDIRKINTRFWKHDLHRPNSYKVIDTLVSARSIFGLTYNSMDAIAEFIGADQKLETEFELWDGCSNGDEDSLDEMLTYNEQDVRTQEQIYMSMREWMPNHPSFAIYSNLVNVCPVCLKNEYASIGFYVANKKKYREYRCCSCHSIWHRSKAVK